MTDEQIYKLACKAADITPLGIDGRPRQIVCSEGKDSKGNPITIQLTWGFQYDFLRNFLAVVSDSQALADQVVVGYALEPDAIKISIAVDEAVAQEREACANLAEQMVALRVAKAIRGRR